MDYFDRHEGGERALLIHMNIRQATKDDGNDLDEFKLLADSAGATTLGVITGTLERSHAKFFVGTGKAQEIAEAVENTEADLILVNHTLTPSQERNLERLVGCRVVDRTGLILDIFARRARTYEGKLQVELAQLSHLATRLVRGWTHLERQKGGIGLRGPGETQLETDRRLLQVRVGQLKAKLAKVKQTRTQGRSRRQKSDIPTISLVGYTNAGKSTLFNQLTNDTIYAADQLFATLDPTLRSVLWAGLGKVVLADTVGFVKNLPHELVESFHATLEETLEADLLLHVIDSSSDEAHEQIDAVNAVLSKIQADAPILLVYNKIDQSQDEAGIHYKEQGTPSRVYLSAKEGTGIHHLTQAVTELLSGHTHTFHLTLPPTQGAFINQLHQLDVITDKTYLDNGDVALSVFLTSSKLRQLLGEYQLQPNEVLTPKQAAMLSPILEAFEKSQSMPDSPNRLDNLGKKDAHLDEFCH